MWGGGRLAKLRALISHQPLAGKESLAQGINWIDEAVESPDLEPATAKSL